MTGLHGQSLGHELRNGQQLRRAAAFLVSFTCGILSGGAMWLVLKGRLPPGDLGRDAEAFWHGLAFFAAMGGALGLGSGYLSALLITRRAVVWQIGVVFLGVALLLAFASRIPNVGVVAWYLVCLTLVQPVFCPMSGLGLRSAQIESRNPARSSS